MLYIYTLNWDGEDKLKKLVPSLLSALENIEYKWFIKDNKSKDNSINYIESLNNDNIHIVKYHNNIQNFSEGMNFLFKESNPNDNDLILLLNNDVIINNKSSIKNMIKIIEEDKDVGVVGAKLTYTDTNLIQHCGVAFHPFNKMPFHIFAKNKKDNDHFVTKNRLFQAVTGAVLLTRASLYKNICVDNKSGIQGMDEDYHWAFDDIDLCLSIKYKMNKKIVYCAGTNIYHEESSSLKKNPVNKLFMNHNMLRLLNKWKDFCVVDATDYMNNINHNLYNKSNFK